uniref:Uncharacterized protein n=1 Tax=Arundo donax TaxID=35708 RepID=A0A0A8XS82_ARUDO
MEISLNFSGISFLQWSQHW